MQIGIGLRFDPKYTGPGPQDIVDLVRHVEDVGFDMITIPEHVAIPVRSDTYYRWGNEGQIPDHYSRMSDPYIVMAMAAAVTSRIQLGTGISILPQREPIALAKTIATLDYYSGGRTFYAFGTGWLKEEVELFGVDFKTRWQRWMESVAAMKAIWTQDAASFDGEIIKFPPLKCEPKPPQPGGPKILVGVHRPDRAFPMVINGADGWFPLMSSPSEKIESVSGVDSLVANIRTLRAMAVEAGRDPDSLVIRPILKPAGPDGIAQETLDALHAVGVRSIVLLFAVYGTSTISDMKASIEKYRFLIDRVHRTGMATSQGAHVG